MKFASVSWVISAAILGLACGAASAAPASIHIPPPGKTPEATGRPVPQDLLRKADAASLAYVDCRFAVGRDAHQANLSASDFARNLAKSCAAEEMELKRKDMAILQFRGDPTPRATIERFAQERRANAIEVYRKNKAISKELQDLEAKCGSDYRRCPN